MSAMAVPFLDLARSTRAIRPELDQAIARVLDSGHFLLGPELQAFEDEWARYCQAPYAVGLASGLDALVLALMAFDIGPGDEVIVPANTYIATVLAISQVGATPILVEPDPISMNLDPARLPAALTKRTKAILPVHLYGTPADLDPILAFSQEYNLKVIEDAAQAHGARYKGQRIGAHSHAVCWSFYPTKNLGALGDAGAVTTADPVLADRLKVLRNYGQRQRYHCEVLGRNSRMEELQAAILRVKLRHLDAWNARRTEYAKRYCTSLASCPNLVLPFVPEYAESVWHLYPIRHSNRDAFQAKLTTQGIGTIIHYPIPPHKQNAYQNTSLKDGCYPITEEIHRTILSLPLHPDLSLVEIDDVIETLQTFFTESSL